MKPVRTIGGMVPSTCSKCWRMDSAVSALSTRPQPKFLSVLIRDRVSRATDSRPLCRSAAATSGAHSLSPWLSTLSSVFALHSSISDEYGGPELQFMIASRAFGQGYATEAAAKVLDDAREQKLAPKIIATVDIPNVGSIRVLEKLQFEFIAQVESYGSTEMYLYAKEMI